ncbi:MAG: hypothetical protein C0408_08160 [Odoribacter sp.]|nr:hypothetical protein [Odoribacter sp.]
MKNRTLSIVWMVFIVMNSIMLMGNNHSTPVLKDKYKIKMTEARMKYNEENYAGALRIYREIYDANKTNDKLNYMMGMCYFYMGSKDESIKYFEAAQKSNPKVDRDLPLVLGQCYQFIGELDKALEQYNKYRASLNPKKMKTDEVTQFIDQCMTAKELMSKPVKVTFKNMGKDVNCEFDDAVPSLSADGKTLIFTSRRPDTEGGGIDPNTGLYYDDIYFTSWDDEKGKWKASDGIAGQLNTVGHDACMSISPDGSMIFVYRNIDKVTGSGDIYYSTLKADGTWGTPVDIGKPVNSTYFESSACLSPDGNTLYFISERLGGEGNADIWMSTKLSGIWQKPVNLGKNINTIEDELGVFMHPDGKTLFFTSKGHRNMGGYDVFISRYVNGRWIGPFNMGYPINTTKDETHFILSTEGAKAYVSSRRDNGMGGLDLYEIDMTNYVWPAIDSAVAVIDTNKVIVPKNTFKPELSILKGSIIDGNTGQKLSGDVVITDAASRLNAASISTNAGGEYFITLKGDKEYIVTVEKRGYKKYSDKVMLPLGEKKTYTLDKLIVLEKE